ncbi:MAG: hypothetical protein MIO93_11395, partial [ANME-2 cluster archaeon]|nr:hypothetical protein [ANME-2 cluster archaeon]
LKRISILSILAVMLLVFSIGAVSAFGGKFLGMDSESREDMMNAIEAKDFDAWNAAKSDRMTEEKFNDRVDRHVARSVMHDAKSDMRELREDKKLAIEAGDYEAFKLAAKDWPMLSQIENEDDFELLVQIHQAKMDGDDETVEKLREQLGMLGGFGKPEMSGQFGR